MSNEEHAFENAIAKFKNPHYDGDIYEDFYNDINTKELPKEVADAVWTCVQYTIYTLFMGDKELLKKVWDEEM